jgi:hypothetical protein
MLRAALLFALTMLSIPALASWTEVTESVRGAVYYVDVSTIKKDGHTKTFWNMVNYSEPTEFGAMSARFKDVIDCNRETQSSLAHTWFSKPDLEGAVINNYTPSNEVRHIAPQTVNAAIMDFVCSK